MGQTLNVASEKNGYTLTDRGTYLAMKKNLSLDILVEGDAILLNIYHVIEVNPAKWPKVNTAGAKSFCGFHGIEGDPGDHQDFRGGKVSGPLSFSPMPARKKRNWGSKWI